MGNGPTMDPRLAQWFASHDTGISSEAIALWLSARARNDYWGDGTPSDAGDFGRCYRLLKAIPEWRPRIGEMAERGGRWPILVAHWDEIERRYEHDLANPGRSDGAYAYMTALRMAPTPPETTA